MSEPNGSRTHEPALRELTANLDSVNTLLAERIDSLKAVLEERDKRYEERFRAQETAVAAALAAQQRLTDAAFAAGKEAVTKQENAQTAYNVSHDDLLRKQDAMMPRLEAEGRLRAQDQKIAELRETSRAGEGGALAMKESKEGARWGINLAFTVGSFMIGIAFSGAMILLVQVLFRK